MMGHAPCVAVAISKTVILMVASGNFAFALVGLSRAVRRVPPGAGVAQFPFTPLQPVVYGSDDSTLGAPVIQDVNVDEINSVYVPDIQAQVADATVEQRKNDYVSLSPEDLAIDVHMGTVESLTKYMITPPPSTCDGATGPAAKLLDCTTPVPPVKLIGFGTSRAPVPMSP